jgi:hypothetical protein
MKQRHISSQKAGSSKYRKRAVRSKTPERVDKSSKPPSLSAIQPFDPEPNAVYSIDAAAQLAGISRRMIVVYCKHNLISPSVDPALWGYWFTGGAIQRIRQIQGLKSRCQNEIQTLSTILGLLDEVRHLHAVIRDREGL